MLIFRFLQAPDWLGIPTTPHCRPSCKAQRRLNKPAEVSNLHNHKIRAGTDSPDRAIATPKKPAKRPCPRLPNVLLTKRALNKSRRCHRRTGTPAPILLWNGCSHFLPVPKPSAPAERHVPLICQAPRLHTLFAVWPIVIMDSAECRADF